MNRSFPCSRALTTKRGLDFPWREDLLLPDLFSPALAPPAMPVFVTFDSSTFFSSSIPVEDFFSPAERATAPFPLGVSEYANPRYLKLPSPLPVHQLPNPRCVSRPPCIENHVPGNK